MNMFEKIFESILEKTFMPIISTVIFIVVYSIIFVFGVQAVNYMGFSEPSIFNIGLSVFFANFLSFIATYITGIIYKLMPFMDYSKYKRHFHIVHHLIIYFSGLMSLLAAIGPFMNKEMGTDLVFREDFLFAFGIIFFISISNYNIYNSIVFDNIFDINIEDCISNGVIVILNLTMIMSFAFYLSIWYRNLELGLKVNSTQIILVCTILICAVISYAIKKRNFV